MAEGAKTYTESEHLAILSDRVAQETTQLSSERDTLKTERDDLANKLDVAESAKGAAETRATEVQGEFETFKTDVEEREAAALRKDDRVAKMREAAKHLKDEFFTDEDRVKRVIAMEDTAFEGYLLDLTASAIPAGTTTATPRETAMVGQAVQAGAEGKAGRDFLLRRFATSPAKEA